MTRTTLRGALARPALTLLLVTMLVVTLLAGVAGAAPAISAPRGNPYVVKVDAQGRPVPFTVSVTGFPAGSLVYVEQCDGRPPTSPNWLPTRDCDLGSSPAAAIVDAHGNARFPAGDPNHAFPAFTGLGPEGLFRCLSPGAAPGHDQLPEYRTCQVRVSSNNNVTTSDQVFLPIAFGSASAPAPTTGSTSAKAGSGGSSSSSSGTVIAAVAVLVVGAGVLIAFARKRRRAAGTA
ncbi:MAG TPA: hypothetical protein VGP92_07480 [Acidimicrobiia bacterium]|nr:hypothetical protein [Acidimicrobiia bacterium]